MSLFYWRFAEGEVPGPGDYRDGEPARKLEEYQSEPPLPIHVFCPQCLWWRATRFALKAAAFAEPSATKAEREQFLTGLCSDECWRAYLSGGGAE